MIKVDDVTKKTRKNIIQNGCNFLINHTECFQLEALDWTKKIDYLIG